jgi:hypothetical protein
MAGRLCPMAPGPFPPGVPGDPTSLCRLDQRSPGKQTPVGRLLPLRDEVTGP